jgi:hypothetical protein
MTKQIKIFAYYLPQFHTIPENDAVWGKGFTEWTNVKKAEKLFENHYQPRVPLGENYYSLTNKSRIQWQMNLARKFGIDGFAIYHYWYNGKKLLEAPLEMIRDNSELDLPIMIVWANHDWNNGWSAEGEVQTLYTVDYSDKKDWKLHFDYLLSFFKMSSYLKEDDKPVLGIYEPDKIPNLDELIEYWNNLAIENGFKGIKFSYQAISEFKKPGQSRDNFDFQIEYQPQYAWKSLDNKSNKKNIINFIKKVPGMRNLMKKYVDIRPDSLVKKRQYRDVVQEIVSRKAVDSKSVAGFYVGWDNTPRKKSRGTVDVGSNPQIFQNYLVQQLENISKNYSNQYLFIFAWNEWAEGGYLEPDEKYGYQYLEAIKTARKISKK